MEKKIFPESLGHTNSAKRKVKAISAYTKKIQITSKEPKDALQPLRKTTLSQAPSQ
jgi:hypothetical protein